MTSLFTKNENGQPTITEAKDLDTHSSRKPRSFLTVPSAPMKAFRAKYGFTTRQLGDALGLSQTSISQYELRGKMPKHVAIAIEGLIRRQGANPTTGLTVSIAQVPPEHAETFAAMAKALGVTLIPLKL